MPKMQFSSQVNYDNEVYAMPGEIKNVPDEMVDRWKKRGAVLVSDIKKEELVHELEDDIKTLGEQEGFDPKSTVVEAPVEDLEVDTDGLDALGGDHHDEEKVVKPTVKEENKKGKHHKGK